MSGIYWLASYPKSGNTWVRAFLANYLSEKEEPVSINNLRTGPISSNREIFDETAGYESGELRLEEIERLRPEVYRQLARENEKTLYCKAHDAFTYLPDGSPMFPLDVTRGAVYLVRNPLDVCVSFAYHSGREAFERTLQTMNSSQSCLVSLQLRQFNQLPQRLLSWSDHIKSWTNARGLRIKVFRYEDMNADPIQRFTEMVDFLELPADTQRIQKAVNITAFEKLQAMEKQEGFAEKMPQAKQFFRKGKIGDWRNHLTAEHVRQIIAVHGEMMADLAYLGSDGQPIF